MHSPTSQSDLTMATAMASVALILILGAVLGGAVRRFRQPAVIGEIAAGIALGPSLLGQLPGNLTEKLFPAEARPMLGAIAQVGLLLFMFMVGWEFDKSLLRRRRTAAVAVSLSSVVLSFGLGVCLALVIHERHASVDGRTVSDVSLALFLGAAMSITAFPVLARILADNKLMRTPVGALALAGAAIDDVLAWCILAVVSATVTASGGADLLQIAGLSALYVLLMFLVVRPVLATFVPWLTRRGPGCLLVLSAGGALLSAYATTWIGIHAIFGAFLFGLVLPREPAEALRTHVRGPLETVSTVLMPTFFIVTGLGVDIAGLSAANYLELAAIIAVACAGKMLGAGAAARAVGMAWPQAGTLALLMNTRGLTELIILNVGVGLGILDTSLFTMMVIMALVTTAMAGPLLPRNDTVWQTELGERPRTQLTTP